MTWQIFAELAITIVVIGFQCFFFRATLFKIRAISAFFPKDSYGEEDIRQEVIDEKTIKLLIEHQWPAAGSYKKLIGQINLYLKKNHGMTDFGIIKNMLERTINTMENQVTASSSMPVYIGLMGTFLGIIAGLSGIALGDLNESNIKLFIGGVVIAMGGSFLGLLLTVINNAIIFRDAKAICDQKKNAFYGFLEAELLPHLENSIYASLTTLKDNVDKFNTTFKENISGFDDKLKENVGKLGSAVLMISKNMQAVIEGTATQKEFLEQLKKVGSIETANANLKVFAMIKETGPNLIEFIEKQKELTASIVFIKNFSEIIERVFDRIKSFEDSLNKLGSDIAEKKYLGNAALERIDKNLSHLDTQYKLLSRHGEDTTAKIEVFFNSEKARIQALIKKIEREIDEALNPNITGSPYGQLNRLETIDGLTKEILEKITAGPDFGVLETQLINIRDKIDPNIQGSPFGLQLNRLKEIDDMIKDILEKVAVEPDFSKLEAELMNILGKIDPNIQGSPFGQQFNRLKEIDNMIKTMLEKISVEPDFGKLEAELLNIRNKIDPDIQGSPFGQLKRLESIDNTIRYVLEKIAVEPDLRIFEAELMNIGGKIELILQNSKSQIAVGDGQIHLDVAPLSKPSPPQQADEEGSVAIATNEAHVIPPDNQANETVNENPDPARSPPAPQPENKAPEHKHDADEKRGVRRSFRNIFRN